MAVKNSAAEVQMLKDRIQNLEKEVADYKRRLADLRKAKNQTILKREREIVEVKTPFQRRSSDIGPQRNHRDEAAPRDNHVSGDLLLFVKKLTFKPIFLEVGRGGPPCSKTCDYSGFS